MTERELLYLYLTHESRTNTAQRAATALRKMENPPVHIVLFGSVARDQDDDESDTDILVSHSGNSSQNQTYQQSVCNYLLLQGFTIYEPISGSQATGKINVIAVENEFFENPSLLRALNRDNHKFICVAKAEGIEL